MLQVRRDSLVDAELKKVSMNLSADPNMDHAPNPPTPSPPPPPGEEDTRRLCAGLVSFAVLLGFFVGMVFVLQNFA